MRKMSSLLKQIVNAYPYPDKLRIRDPNAVGAMVDSLAGKGPEALQVITDFDFTLTRTHMPDGTPATSGPGVLNNSSLMSEEFKNKLNSLAEKYRPIEFDHNIPLEKKIPLMVEWYKRRKALVVAERVTRAQMEEMVKTCRVMLRDGAKDCLELLHEMKVPVLIFSAGNGDVIDGIMKRDQALFNNAHIISNFYKYDDEGYVVDYMSSTLLHVFNKNEHAVENSSYFEDLSHRPNALLLGDHTADASMADGMHDPETIFKIGFLNDHTKEMEETLKLYESIFDVVLINDPTFDFVNILLNVVLKNNSSKQ